MSAISNNPGPGGSGPGPTVGGAGPGSGGPAAAPAFDFGRYARPEGWRGGAGGGGGRGGGGERGGDRAGGRPRAPLGKLFDRQPPAAVTAELCLLGSLILDPRVASDVVQVVRGPEMFYEPSHGLIYQAIVELYDRHHTGDLAQLEQKLADRGVLEQVGGMDFLVRLAQEVPTAANASHYARIVAEKAKLRRLIDAAGQILYDTYHAGSERDEDASAVIDQAERMIFEIAQEESAEEPQALGKLLDIEIARLEAKQRGEAPPSGVQSGFHELDTMLGGFQPGEMIIIAARPSMGKTAFVLNLAEQMALATSGPRQPQPDSGRERAPVGFFSLEMSKAALVQRLLASYSGINSQAIQRSVLGRGDYQALLDAANTLETAELFIDDTPSMTILQLRARARRMVAQHGVKAVMIDYLQLLSAPGAARESRQVEVGAISRGVKALARELKVPVLCLSQLNRGPESRDQNKPRLSDLRESGSLEQDADVVMLLHREEYYHIGDANWEAENPDKVGLAEVIIAKQRNGPTGTVKLTWDGKTTRFKNHAEGMSEYGIGAAPAPRAAPAPNAAPAGGPRGPGSRGSLAGPAYTPPSGAAQPGNAGAPPVQFPASRVGGGAFAAGRSTGPVANHRDGGGPDRDDANEPPRPARPEAEGPVEGPGDGYDPDEPAPF